MATPDWEAIESAYRAGVLSLRDIGDKYGVTEGAIRKRAKKFDWVRKASTQVRKNGTQSGTQKSKARTSEKPASSGRTQKVRNQNLSRFQKRNRYAECVPIPQPIHSRPVISML
ncbi:Uncharacterised protein [Klebsiella pneumoniae]|nr:Uncharacterised protein [Klebsiella pneumoniae]